MRLLDSATTIAAVACFLAVSLNSNSFLNHTEQHSTFVENLANITQRINELHNFVRSAVEAAKQQRPIATPSNIIGRPPPKALVLGHQISASNVAQMEEVVLVLQRHGYDVTFELPPPQESSSLSLIWAFEWPFYHQQLNQVYTTQIVNHFPNTGALTSKVELATMRTGHVPISFRMPDEYEEWLNYTKSNAHLKWLTKSNGHRGISLIDPATFKPNGGSFVQQFIDEPLLIDDFKIDLGIYVLITSAVPLRVYVFDHEVWIRACPEPYHPFDSANTRKYVIDADHRPPWDLPSFAKFSEEGSTLKQAFTQYLTTRGYDATALFEQVNANIRSIFQLLGHRIATGGGKASDHRDIWDDSGLNADGVSKRFDLMRFDFLIQLDSARNKLRPWLMEVNFSPNLWAIKLPPNRRIYRQILYDVFSITGAAYNHQPEGFFDKNLLEIGLVAENDLHVSRPACSADDQCDDKADMKCKICKKQWPPSFGNTLKQTSFEQLARRHFRRVLPPEPPSGLSLDGLNNWLNGTMGSLWRTTADKALATWIFLKCQTERHWCA